MHIFPITIPCKYTANIQICSILLREKYRSYHNLLFLYGYTIRIIKLTAIKTSIIFQSSRPKVTFINAWNITYQ